MNKAVRFLGTGASCDEVLALWGGPDPAKCVWKSCTYDGGFVVTPDGPREFCKGDWVILDGNGTLHVASDLTALRWGLVRAMMVAWAAGEVSEERLVEATGLDRLTLRCVLNACIDIGKSHVHRREQEAQRGEAK